MISKHALRYALTGKVLSFAKRGEPYGSHLTYPREPSPPVKNFTRLKVTAP